MHYVSTRTQKTKLLVAISEAQSKLKKKNRSDFEIVSFSIQKR